MHETRIRGRNRLPDCLRGHCFNLAHQLTQRDSPSFRIVTEAKKLRTQGWGKKRFDQAKSRFLEALRFTLSAAEEDSFGEIRSPKSSSSSPNLSNKVFVVHGTDPSLKTDVERFIHQIGLKPVACSLSFRRSESIPERLQQYGYVFLVQLLTSNF